MSSISALENVYQEIARNLRTHGAAIVPEDAYPGFVNFFAEWKAPQLNGLCTTVGIVLIDVDDHASEGRIEFYCQFFTSKGWTRQRALSTDGYRQLKQFITEKFFAPISTTAPEYYPPKRDYNTAASRALFVDRTPGVIITIGGQVTVTNNPDYSK